MSLIKTAVKTCCSTGILDYYLKLENVICRSQVRVVMYHRIGYGKEYPWVLKPTPVDYFEKQLDYICKNFHVLSVDQLIGFFSRRECPPRRSVLLTFDDGYKDNYVFAFPLLKKRNLPSTMFIITGNINTRDMFWTDTIRYLILNSDRKYIILDDTQQYSIDSIQKQIEAISSIIQTAKTMTPEVRTEFIEKITEATGVYVPDGLGDNLILTWNEIKEMSENKITFGAHTVSHTILTNLSEEQIRYEILHSKREIVNRLNMPVTAFAYPNGKQDDFNSHIINILEENDFALAFSAIPGISTINDNPYSLHRISPSNDLCLFKLLLCGSIYKIPHFMS